MTLNFEDHTIEGQHLTFETMESFLKGVYRCNTSFET